MFPGSSAPCVWACVALWKWSLSAVSSSSLFHTKGDAVSTPRMNFFLPTGQHTFRWQLGSNCKFGHSKYGHCDRDRTTFKILIWQQLNSYLTYKSERLQYLNPVPSSVLAAVLHWFPTGLLPVKFVMIWNIVVQSTLIKMLHCECTLNTLVDLPVLPTLQFYNTHGQILVVVSQTESTQLPPTVFSWLMCWAGKVLNIIVNSNNDRIIDYYSL